MGRTLGHVDMIMVFNTYSRYIPNMTRRDGIKNYQRDDGRAFMENVYNVSSTKNGEENDEKSGLDMS